MAEIDSVYSDCSAGDGAAFSVVGDDELVILDKTLERLFQAESDLNFPVFLEVVFPFLPEYKQRDIPSAGRLKHNGNASDEIFMRVVAFDDNFIGRVNSNGIGTCVIFCIFVGIVSFGFA